MATRSKTNAPHTFDEDSHKRIARVVRVVEQTPRGGIPPRRRWPISTDAEVVSFRAILYNKISYPIGGASDASEGGDLLWEDPLSDFLYGNCPPAFPDRLRGEWDWVQATETIAAVAASTGAATDFDEDFGEIGVWMPMEGGWCGFAGECDAAHEYNRSACNIHLERNTVEIVAGIVPVRVPCGELEDVQITVKGRTVTAKRFGRRAWWNGNMPREDCADRYMITMSPDNDTPSA